VYRKQFCDGCFDAKSSDPAILELRRLAADRGPSRSEQSLSEISQPAIKFPVLKNIRGWRTMAQTQQTDMRFPEVLEIDLPIFEGPFDLLLELIEEHEVDIFDIPISLITNEYLEYIEKLESLNLELGAEWLQMAARLTYIKSRMLLPATSDDDEDEPDPREKLAWQLVQHKKYQLILDKMDKLPRLGRDVFATAGREDDFRKQTGPPDIEGANIGALHEAVVSMLESEDQGQQEEFTVSRVDITVGDVIEDVSQRLQSTERITFQSLFGSRPTKPRVIIGFLALLEMAKIDLIWFDNETDVLFIRRRTSDIPEQLEDHAADFETSALAG
jgi:segregation and condensation protein A